MKTLEDWNVFAKKFKKSSFEKQIRLALKHKNDIVIMLDNDMSGVRPNFEVEEFVDFNEYFGWNQGPVTLLSIMGFKTDEY